MFPCLLIWLYAKPVVDKILLEPDEKSYTKSKKVADDLEDLEDEEMAQERPKRRRQQERPARPYPPIEDYQDEFVRKRPVMVVGSYLGGQWLISNKKDSVPSAQSGDNSIMCNIPAIIIGYGDVLGEHIYLGIEGGFGYGLKGTKDKNNITECARWHTSILGHIGFYLSPSARVYGILGLDKTSYVREQQMVEDGKTVSKKIADATGITGSFGAGLMITLSSRFGFGIEGRYTPKKSWSFAGNQQNEKTKISAWQMGAKVIIFV